MALWTNEGKVSSGIPNRKQYMAQFSCIWFKRAYWEMLPRLVFSTEKRFSSLSNNSVNFGIMALLFLEGGGSYLCSFSPVVHKMFLH